MAQWKTKSNRRTTGGLLKKNSKKKKYQMGRDFLPARIGARKIKTKRSRGGGQKVIVMSGDIVNVSVAGKIQKAKILNVSKNRADSQFVRRNIITKGAVIDTDIGKARVTSRPGQHGVINEVLLEKK